MGKGEERGLYSMMRTGVWSFWMMGLFVHVGARVTMSSPQNSGEVTEHGFECTPCESLFSKLELSPEGHRIQKVEMVERGEPKSGTGFMYSWAEAALRHACDFLRTSFGEESCRIEVTGEGSEPAAEKTLIFDPSLGRDSARCSCVNVDRVTITTSRIGKHALPVDQSCAWGHSGGITKSNKGCLEVDGREVENHYDLWKCMHRAACDITDDRLQMVVIRDPRPTVVSTYFHHIRFNSGGQLGTIEEFVEKMLPTICQWVAIRHILFDGFMSDKVAFFWYDRANEQPLEWHQRWYNFVGLNLPSSVVENAADFAKQKTVVLNGHPGGAKATKSRDFRDEVDQALLLRLDDILRIWLPPVLLARLGVPA